jgi:hypothetical protein
MDRAAILRKIEKCMAIAKDGRGDAFETAAALRQAQKLIDRHNISPEDLHAIGYGKETVHTSVQVNKKALPLRVNNLCMIIEKAFGVVAVIYATKRQSDWSYSVDYYGPQDKTITAVYSHTVVQRALDQAYKEYIAENPLYKRVRGVRASFETGWLREVRHKIEFVARTAEEIHGTQAALAKDGYSDLKESTVSRQTIYSNISEDGAEAAEDFSLFMPVATEPLKLEKQ